MRLRAVRKAQADEFPMNFEGARVFFDLFSNLFAGQQRTSEDSTSVSFGE
jgi:hypothetical protein